MDLRNSLLIDTGFMTMIYLKSTFSFAMFRLVALTILIMLIAIPTKSHAQNHVTNIISNPNFVVTKQQKHGDWNLQCLDFGNSESTCFIYTQSTTKNGTIFKLFLMFDGEELRLANIFYYSRQVKENEKGTFKFDNNMMLNVDLACSPKICFDIAWFKDIKKVLQFYEKGNKAFFTYSNGKRKEISQISLKGTTAAIAALVSLEYGDMSSKRVFDPVQFDKDDIQNNIDPISSISSFQYFMKCVDSKFPMSERVDSCRAFRSSENFNNQQMAMALGLEAEAVVASNDLGAEIMLYDQALELDPSNLQLIARKAELHGYSNQIEQAEKTWISYWNLFGTSNELTVSATREFARLMLFAGKPEAKKLLDRKFQCGRALDSTHTGYAVDKKVEIFVNYIKSIPGAFEECVKLYEKPKTAAVVNKGPSQEKINEAAAMDNPKLCSNALTTKLAEWEKSLSFKAFVNEAQKRGLSVYECAKAARTIDTTISPGTANSKPNQGVTDRRIEASELITSVSEYNTTIPVEKADLKVARKILELGKMLNAFDPTSFNVKLDELWVAIKANLELAAYVENKFRESEARQKAMDEINGSRLAVNAEFATGFAIRNLAHPAAPDLITFADKAKIAIEKREFAAYPKLETEITELAAKWQLVENLKTLFAEKCASGLKAACAQ